NDALSQGFARIENKKGERLGAGVRLPGATEIIRDIHDEEANYRLLSAVAHGHYWALINLNYITSAASDVTVNGVNLHAFEKRIYVDAVAVFGVTVMQCFARPLWNQCKYFGWHENGLEEMLEHVADKMDLTRQVRFWRPEEARK